jgi:heme exporter protein C
MWWKLLLFFWIAAFSAIGIYTPIAGTLGDVAMMGQLGSGKEIPVKFSISDRATAALAGDGSAFVMRGSDAQGRSADFAFASKPADFDAATGYIVQGRYDAAAHRVIVSKVLSTNPGMTFPFIPGLEERAKIILFHVPVSWMTVIAFLVSMWYGIRYLRKKDLEDDTKSAISAGLGLLFCILATTTGSVWAKFNWGSFWNWDPRETSIFVLLLVYGAYFALRSALDIEEKRASLSAVYGILAFVTVPFFIFIMPRILPGLHPGSADDANSGPVVSSGGMNATMRIVLYSMLLGHIVLYAWLMRLRLSVTRLMLRKADGA